MFSKSFRFIPGIHLIKSPSKALAKRRAKLGRWSVRWEGLSNQICYFQFSHVATAGGFLLVQGATIAAHDCPIAGHDAMGCYVQLFSKWVLFQVTPKNQKVQNNLSLNTDTIISHYFVNIDTDKNILLYVFFKVKPGTFAIHKRITERQIVGRTFRPQNLVQKYPKTRETVHVGLI